jgi:glycosyltransferase involved in cell wall biosynthesis
LASQQVIALASPFRTTGGVTQLIQALASDNGHSLRFVVLVPDDGPRTEGAEPAPIRPLPRPRRPSEALAYSLGFPRRQHRLAKALTSIGADVLIAFGLNVLDVAAACRGARVPYVLSLNSDRGRLAQPLLRTAARHAGAVLSEGPGVRDALLGRRWTGDVIEFLPPVVIPEAPLAHPSGARLELGMLCNFTPQKDHLLAIDTIAAARAMGADVGLRMAGDSTEPSAYRDRVADQIQRHGLGDVVHMTGWAKPSDFLGTVDALLVTSHFEGVATSTVEGMAAGRPFVARPVGSLPHLAATSGGGWCTRPVRRRRDTASELGRLVASLASGDRSVLTMAGARGRAFAAGHCTWASFDAKVRLAIERATASAAALG